MSVPTWPPSRTCLFVAGAVLGGGAGLLFVSGTDEPAGQPGANVSRCRGRRYDVLHLHDTASLLVGRGIQRSRNRQHGASDSSPQKASIDAVQGPKPYRKAYMEM